MVLRCLIVLFAALTLGACEDGGKVKSGKVDDWTWEEPKLKCRTSPNKLKRARADVVGKRIKLNLGEVGGDHPADIADYQTEIIPLPKNGKWDMQWLDNENFVFEHSELGTKTWRIENTLPIRVTVSADWQSGAAEQ